MSEVLRSKHTRVQRYGKVGGLLVAAAAFVGGCNYLEDTYFAPHREAKAAEENMAINTATDELESTVEDLQMEGMLAISIADGVDYARDPEAKITVEYGNCSGSIPLRQEWVHYGDVLGRWDRAESGGKKNLLAIPDEFGNVMGYLSLTTENILASFPEDCLK